MPRSRQYHSIGFVAGKAVFEEVKDYGYAIALSTVESRMDALTIAASSGMRARMESLEMLANNIANQTSPGYKADREFYSLYIAPEAIAASGATPSPTVPVIERHWTDFAQGTLAETGNPLHLAISGEGFFTVAGPNGKLHTRNGSFQLSGDGAIQTQQGYNLLDRGGQPIQLDARQPFEVTPGGQVRQGGVVVGEIGVVVFEQQGGLAKHSGTFFQWTGAGTGPQDNRRASLHQRKLESANCSPAEAAVRLVNVLRQFEMLQKAVQIGSEMGRRSDDVARVGS
jgi:flagellar basal body rod protein FlgG